MSKFIKNFLRVFLITSPTILTIVAVFFLPDLTQAEINYTPLTGDTAGKLSEVDSFSELLQNIYNYSIVIAGMLAVIMIAIGGFQYMGSDAYSTKQSAKERITNAIIGLLIVISAVLILETINPGITDLELFSKKQDIIEVKEGIV